MKRAFDVDNYLAADDTPRVALRMSHPILHTGRLVAVLTPDQIRELISDLQAALDPSTYTDD
jgi:hypothetical protein